MPFVPDYEVPEERKPYTLLNEAKSDSDSVGCLMLHGFLGSPYSSRAMAEYLAGLGISMHAPLLPGHGQYPDKLYKIPMSAWQEEAAEAFVSMLGHSEKLVLIAHSMGAILAANLYVNHPLGRDNIQGIVMIAPIYDVPDSRLRLMWFAKYAMPWFYPHRSRSMQDLVRQRVKDFDPTIDFDDPEFQELLPSVSRLPTSGLHEMVKMVDLGKKLWPLLDLPVLILQGGHDPAIKPEDQNKIFDELPGPKENIIYPESGHEIMRPFDPVHKQVWQKVHEFIQQNSTDES